jgi:hypothetical protein
MSNLPPMPDPAHGRQSGRSRTLPWIFFGFLAVAGFFLFTEHRAHLMGALPFILLALCPLMHVFHRGHGSHGHHGVPGSHGNADPAGAASAGPNDGDSSRSTSPPPRPSPRAPHQH